MANNKTEKNKLRAKRLTRRLESHPEMLDRFESILDLAENDGGASFDEIEERLVEEVRSLGGETLGSWLDRREEALGEATRAESKGTQQRGKKN
ncbi:MAG: hypothetical protein ACLFSZ_07970 [Puniceicoccaceae bacterium]